MYTYVHIYDTYLYTGTDIETSYCHILVAQYICGGETIIPGPILLKLSLKQTHVELKQTLGLIERDSQSPKQEA